MDKKDWSDKELEKVEVWKSEMTENICNLRITEELTKFAEKIKETVEGAEKGDKFCPHCLRNSVDEYLEEALQELIQ